MQRTGATILPLHYGKAPQWLTARMKKLATQITSVVVDEYGNTEFLKRLSDPYWFQAFGCVLGYDWHSSGVTTVVTGILKEAVTPQQHGIAICGGKGKASKQAPHEIQTSAETFGLSTAQIQSMKYASKMSAKVDNTAIQAGYQLYHHAFILTEQGKWAVIQQGMCTQDRTARRYHWLSESVEDFIVEPHNAIVCNIRRSVALNMTARESEGSRKASLDIARQKPEQTKRTLMPIFPACQKSLQEWITENPANKKLPIKLLSMPRRINWKALKETYEFQPTDYEQLISFKGIGPATVKGLALIAELVYGEKPSWKDPVKYSFAYGGKDGVPYPVDRKAMDESIQMLKVAIEESRIGSKDKIHSLQRLRRFVPISRSI